MNSIEIQSILDNAKFTLEMNLVSAHGEQILAELEEVLAEYPNHQDVILMKIQYLKALGQDKEISEASQNLTLENINIVLGDVVDLSQRIRLRSTKILLPAYVVFIIKVLIMGIVLLRCLN